MHRILDQYQPRLQRLEEHPGRCKFECGGVRLILSKASRRGLFGIPFAHIFQRLHDAARASTLVSGVVVVTRYHSARKEGDHGTGSGQLWMAIHKRCSGNCLGMCLCEWGFVRRTRDDDYGADIFRPIVVLNSGATMTPRTSAGTAIQDIARNRSVCPVSVCLRHSRFLAPIRK